MFILWTDLSYSGSFNLIYVNVKKKMFYGADRLIFQKAKYLRNHVTNAEMIFWGRLKERFPNYKFRRQHPLSKYIADFYCHKLKLVIELDGSVHNLQHVQRRDEEREAIIKSLGLQIVRFTNEDITLRLEQCIELIERLVHASTSHDSK